MATQILSVVGTPYRGTIEEQDDTVLWLTHMLQSSGLGMTVLLRASAVNYAVQGQDASGLRFGDVAVQHPPALDADLAGLLDHAVPVYYVEEDAEERGIRPERMVEGVKSISRSELPALFDRHEQVWAW